MMKKVFTIFGLLTSAWLTIGLFPVSLSVAGTLDNDQISEKIENITSRIKIDEKGKKYIPMLSAKAFANLTTQQPIPQSQDEKRTRGMPQAEQNKALEARKLANIIPYGQIARRAKKRFGGRIVNQKLFQTGLEKWVYELKVLRKNGKVVSVTMDAQTGKILKTRGERRR
jgi:uncharacterized membrane protein YkoI